MLPTRVIRLFKHLLLPFGLFKGQPQSTIINSVIDWLVGVAFYFIDILGIPELYEIMFELFKWNIRDMNEEELRLSETFFGETLKCKQIRLDEKAYIGPKQYRFAYVSFHTINSYGGLNKPIFVHELVHIWQYHLLGSIYTYKALRAQHSKAGYNYGGFRRLYFAFERRKSLLSFNFEQQADIIMNGFKYYEGVAKKKHQRDELKEVVYSFYLDQVLKRNGFDFAQKELERKSNRRV